MPWVIRHSSKPEKQNVPITSWCWFVFLAGKLWRSIRNLSHGRKCPNVSTGFLQEEFVCTSVKTNRIKIHRRILLPIKKSHDPQIRWEAWSDHTAATTNMELKSAPGSKTTLAQILFVFSSSFHCLHETCTVHDLSQTITWSRLSVAKRADN